jgi:hypothetical protein
MPGLSEQKIQIVRRLVETSPDRIVGALQAALAEARGDAALSEVRRLVEAEAEDRRLRNQVLQPVAVLFRPETAGSDALAFPPQALAYIWRGLKQLAPADVAAAAELLEDFRPGETSPHILDELTLRAGAALRAGETADFTVAIQLCDSARTGGADLLAKCIDLAPICRAATLRLGDWISRTTEANTAAARLAYKDAVAVADDAGCRFFEMLAAQLAHPWMVLRIISAVMDRPSEAYFAGSELAPFALRLFDEIDGELAAITHLDPAGGARAGVAAAKQVEAVSLQINEIEESIETVRTGLWGSRLAGQKRALAASVEERLRAADKAALAALPSHPVRISKHLKNLPRLNAAPDPQAVQSARTLLTFAHESRTSANHGGFASSRAKLVEKVAEMLNVHVEEVLDALRSGEAADQDIAMAHLETAAEMSVLIGDEKSAELIRRRAAVAAAAAQAAHEPPAA